jgi:hypothetical protein
LVQTSTGFYATARVGLSFLIEDRVSLKGNASQG